MMGHGGLWLGLGSSAVHGIVRMVSCDLGDGDNCLAEDELELGSMAFGTR